MFLLVPRWTVCAFTRSCLATFCFELAIPHNFGVGFRKSYLKTNDLSVMTTKKRILILLGVGAVLVSAELLVIQSAKRFATGLASGIAHAAPAAEDLIKGTMGEALLESRRVQANAADRQAVHPGVPDDHFGTGQSLLDEYRKDPQKFHRFAQVFDTWVNAQKVATASTKGVPNTISESSLSAVGVIPNEKLDAWKHPFCLVRGADRIVMISGGPNLAGPINCREIRMSKAQISATELSSAEQRPDGSLVFTFPRENRKSR